MSIVAVHGPQTFGSKAITEAGPVQAVVVPTNGLQWDLKLDTPTSRPDQDFAWTFPPDGTPTPQNVADPALVTYGSAGNKTAQVVVTNVSRTVNNKALTNEVATLTLSATSGFKVGQIVTVSGVGAPFDGTGITILSTPTGTTFTYARPGAANVTSGAGAGTVASSDLQVPPAGTYQITIPAVAGTGGAGISLLGAEGGGEEPPPEGEQTAPDINQTYTEEDYANFILAEHSIGDVKDFLGHYELVEDDWAALVDEETNGANRVTLLDWLESQTA
jgi:hypothetical protein